MRSTVYSRGGKRALSVALILVTLPAALAIALPIVLVNALIFRDLRRVFFLQERIGRGGKPFRIVKFRTMREVQREAHFQSWCNGDDCLRVTRFGRLLRNTHLDELPQLLNVLRGDMDLIGPRPEMVEVHRWACSVVPGFEHRTEVRPGITGLAQITQGYVTQDALDYRRKLAIDLRYVRSVSLGRDLAIVLRTALWMLGGKGWRPASGEHLADDSPAPSETKRKTPSPSEVATIAVCPSDRAPASSTILSSSSTTRAPRTRSVRVD